MEVLVNVKAWECSRKRKCRLYLKAGKVIDCRAPADMYTKYLICKSVHHSVNQQWFTAGYNMTDCRTDLHSRLYLSVGV